MCRAIGAGLCVMVTMMSANAQEGLRVGAAAVKITPPLGVPMAGYYHGAAQMACTTTCMPKRWSCKRVTTEWRW